MKLNKITVGMRVESGKPGTKDHDTGVVRDINPMSATGHEVLVGWDSHSANWCAASSLRAER
jgi:hypothetical protein